MKKLAIAAVGLLAGASAYLALWPVPVDPVSWNPPAYDPAAWEPTGTLAGAARVELQDAEGPEDVEVDEKGRIYVGVADGRILRFDSPDGRPNVLADTRGRPLGLDWAKDGRLLVADAFRGLLAVDAAGVIEVLTSTCGGTKLVFTDDLGVAADGTVWFSDASVRFPQTEWKKDLLESRPNGRLCAYDPRTKETREVIPKMYFANGVAVDPQQRFVLVNETSRYRVQKHWIAGPKKGTTEVLIDNLPGFPDNLSTGSGGVFWVAIASPRNPLVDAVAGNPFLRKVIVRLPAFLQPAPERTARVIGIDEEGRIRHDLFDPKGSKIHLVTTGKERGGTLYLGSLKDTGFAYLPPPP